MFKACKVRNSKLFRSVADPRRTVVVVVATVKHNYFVYAVKLLIAIVLHYFQLLRLMWSEFWNKPPVVGSAKEL